MVMESLSLVGTYVLVAADSGIEPANSPQWVARFQMACMTKCPEWNVHAISTRHLMGVDPCAARVHSQSDLKPSEGMSLVRPLVSITNAHTMAGGVRVGWTAGMGGSRWS